MYNVTCSKCTLVSFQISQPPNKENPPLCWGCVNPDHLQPTQYAVTQMVLNTMNQHAMDGDFD